MRLKPNKLTSTSYWDANWQHIRLPQLIDPNKSSRSTREMLNLFDKYLPKKLNKKIEFIEIGCAPGTWLEYFYKHYGYKVSGIEYTPAGYSRTLDNLKLLNTPANIVKADFLKYRFTQKYDIVSSFGFLEHFKNPEEVFIKQTGILKPRGYLILEIPNLCYINSFLSRLLAPGSMEIHNTEIMNTKSIKLLFDNNRFRILFLDYVGNFYPFLFPIRAGAVTNFFLTIIRVVSDFIPFKPSKYYSPYLLLIAKKK